MRKIISLGLILAICLGLAGCGNGSKYNLKDAKTCTIEGISFQYPKEWEATDVKSDLDSDKTEHGKYITFDCSSDNNENQTCLMVTIDYKDTKDKKLEFDKKYFADGIQVLDNITVAGQVCYHTKEFYGDDLPGNGEYYYFDSQKGLIIFHAIQNEDCLKILPDILKTVTIEE